MPAYNVPGVSGEIKFTPDALAASFLGRSTNWNDPAIAKANPGISFPNQPIIVIYRSDGSGTTFIFTDYLSKISKDWANNVGKGTSVKWPIGYGWQGQRRGCGTDPAVAGIDRLRRTDLCGAEQDHVRIGGMPPAIS